MQTLACKNKSAQQQTSVLAVAFVPMFAWAQLKLPRSTFFLLPELQPVTLTAVFRVSACLHPQVVPVARGVET